MERIAIMPNDKAHWLSMRTKDITSTEVSCLFGISPYSTEYELWHQKKDATLVEFVENDRTKWGKRLESSIAHGLAEENSWDIRHITEYMRVPELRIGSSFDFMIMKDGKDHAILEIKNVDSLQFKDKWLLDGDNLEAPLHIEMQVQHQMLVSGVKQAYIGALIGGNQVVTLHREFDEAMLPAITKATTKFWASIESGVSPKPNFEKDAEFISKLYSYAEPGKILDATTNPKIKELMAIHKKASEEVKEADERKDAAKAEMLTIIGDAEKVIGEGWSISCGIVAGAQVSYERKPYRNFRPFWKKQKE